MSREELQSTNVKLNNPKENMQSLIEEIQTEDMELQSKLTDFIVADKQMRNLLTPADNTCFVSGKNLNSFVHSKTLEEIGARRGG